MSSAEELQGYLDVKVPSRVRNRGLTPWKAWKRQWVIIKKSSFDGIDIYIGKHSSTPLRVSSDDVLSRTESRTRKCAFGIISHFTKRVLLYIAGNSETDAQKWMFQIRKLLKPPLIPVEDNEFTVSIIDNNFSRASGLCGLYGTLSVGLDCVCICDPFTSKTKVQWTWDMFSHYKLEICEEKQDEGHICVIQTSRHFPSGQGQFRLFCLEATHLVQKLSTRGRASSGLPTPKSLYQNRHHTVTTRFPDCELRQTPSSPILISYRWLNGPLRPPLDLSRRWSRSEGDLQRCCKKVQELHDLKSSSHGGSCESASSLKSTDSSTFLKGKVISTLISAGIGLILSQSPTNERRSSHEYTDINEDDGLIMNLTNRKGMYYQPRRESGVSVASGVYEEIDEDHAALINKISYLDLQLATVEEEEYEPPPPLPPRRGDTWKSSVSDTEENLKGSMMRLPLPHLKYKSLSANNSPTPSPPNGFTHYSPSPTIKAQHSNWETCIKWETEPEYLPMSPVCRQQEEPHYMVMGSVNIS